MNGHRPISKFAFLLLAGWMVFHFSWPLRHYAVPGDSNWTEEGHRFSWRMMLRSKTGVAEFTVVDSELLATSADGTTTVQWEEWSKAFDRTVYVPVDAANINWRSMPRMMVLFDPLVGERIIAQYSHAEGDPVDDLALIKDHWVKSYGRTPSVQATLSLREAIDGIDLGESNDNQGGEQSFSRRVALARELIDYQPRTRADAERKVTTLQQLMTVISDDPKFGRVARKQLGKVHPFLLQGGGAADRCYWIEDFELFAEVADSMKLRRDRWKGGDNVYVDAQRLGPFGWRKMPQVFCMNADGMPRIVWNYHTELSDRQIRKMQVGPFMLHQYAQRIAAHWQEQFGRRPQIYVDNPVMLNYHRPKPCVDPSVDLASVSINLIKHNKWILPFEQDVPKQTIAVTKSKLAQSEKAPKDEAVYWRNGRKKIERRTIWSNGHELTTTKGWTETGVPRMQGEYRDGKLHGVMRTWHRNGKLAMQAEYEAGKRNGLVTMWYADGKKSWEAHYQVGVLHGQVTSWFGDGRVAERGEFRDGSKIGPWTTWDQREGICRRVGFPGNVTLH